MNCGEFERLWQLRLDEGGIPASSSELRHAAECETCRVRHEEFLLLEASLFAWRRQPPQIDMTSRVCAAMASGAGFPDPANRTLQPGARHPSASSVSAAGDRLTRWIFAGLGTAAVVAGVTLSTRVLTSPPVSAPRVVAAGAPAGASELAELPTQTPNSWSSRREQPGQLTTATQADLEFARQTRQAYEPVARTAARAMGDVLSFVGSPSGGSPMAASGDEPDRRRVLSGLQRQIRPIGRGVGEALDFLWLAGVRQSAD
ncbi:MAG: hypothetical protein EHM42_00055 [Planctomycetaceae bacterium]|nr:MAG: hypothetical protein EHM42_00055 [Planctomycetaceae bacterium]